MTINNLQIFPKALTERIEARIRRTIQAEKANKKLKNKLKQNGLEDIPKYIFIPVFQNDLMVSSEKCNL